MFFVFPGKQLAYFRFKLLNIKLSMGKAWFFKVYACNWEGLFLGFICWHCPGNCNLLKEIVASVGNKGILGMKTSPLLHPDWMVALIMCDTILLITSLVPLQNFGGSRFLNKIIEALTLRSDLWGASPDGSNEFQNSTGLFTASQRSITVSNDFFFT